MADNNTFLPRLRGLVDNKVEQEIVQAFIRMYNFFNQENDKLREELNKTGNRVVAIEQSSLFAGRLAIPLIDTDITDVAQLAQQGETLNISQIPNLPASKIVSGDFGAINRINRAKLDDDVLHTEDGLTKIVAAAPYANDGFITIKDDVGNSVRLGTVA